MADLFRNYENLESLFLWSIAKPPSFNTTLAHACAAKPTNLVTVVACFGSAFANSELFPGHKLSETCTHTKLRSVAIAVEVPLLCRSRKLRSVAVARTVDQLATS